MFSRENFFYHIVTKNTLKTFDIKGEHLMVKKKKAQKHSSLHFSELLMKVKLQQ